MTGPGGLTDDQVDRIAAMLREPDDAAWAVLRARVVAFRRHRRREWLVGCWLALRARLGGWSR